MESNRRMIGGGWKRIAVRGDWHGMWLEPEQLQLDEFGEVAR